MQNKLKVAQYRFGKSFNLQFKDVIGLQPRQETCRPTFTEDRRRHEVGTEVPEFQQILEDQCEEDGGSGGGAPVVVAGRVQPDGEGHQQEDQAGRGLSSAISSDIL